MRMELDKDTCYETNPKLGQWSFVDMKGSRNEVNIRITRYRNFN